MARILTNSATIRMTFGDLQRSFSVCYLLNSRNMLQISHTKLLERSEIMSVLSRSMFHYIRNTSSSCSYSAPADVWSVSVSWLSC